MEPSLFFTYLNKIVIFIDSCLKTVLFIFFQYEMFDVKSFSRQKFLIVENIVDFDNLKAYKCNISLCQQRADSM